MRQPFKNTLVVIKTSNPEKPSLVSEMCKHVFGLFRDLWASPASRGESSTAHTLRFVAAVLAKELNGYVGIV